MIVSFANVTFLLLLLLMDSMAPSKTLHTCNGCRSVIIIKGMMRLLLLLCLCPTTKELAVRFIFRKVISWFSNYVYVDGSSEFGWMAGENRLLVSAPHACVRKSTDSGTHNKGHSRANRFVPWSRRRGCGCRQKLLLVRLSHQLTTNWRRIGLTQ